MSLSSTSGSSSSGSNFESLRQISIESDVFYSDLKRSLSLTEDDFPRFMTSEDPNNWVKINDEKLKQLQIAEAEKRKKIYGDVKCYAQTLVWSSAQQCVPKFFNARKAKCVQLHWACMVGWCMCKYQYQPLTPLSKLPETRISRNHVTTTTLLYANYDPKLIYKMSKPHANIIML